MSQLSFNRLKNTAIVIAAISLTGVSTPNHAHEDGHARPSINLSVLSQLRIGGYDQGAAEIVAYDVNSQRAFITNAQDSSVDVISITKPASPTKLFSINLKPYGKVNSVAVHNGTVAVALGAKNKQDNGRVAFFNDQGEHLNTLTVGALPDMLTFTPDGNTLLVANEGEPNSDYSVDPEGTISIIKLDEKQAQDLTQDDVKSVDFHYFDDVTLDKSVRFFGKGASRAQDLEPEYIAVSEDSTTAWISLQENNAIATLNINSGKITKISGLGYKSYNSQKNAIDASDKDGGINIKPWPVLGMYQPDSIASYTYNGRHYIVTANEGDARDYDGYSEETRLAKVTLDEKLLNDYPNIQDEKNLGRLKITTANGDTNGDGKIDQIYSYGARSFSIWNANGDQVFDSNAEFATKVASRYPKLFNKADSRSDDKGAEPEALTLGKVGEQTYAFIGLERTGGIMAYNISNPKHAYYADYINTISHALPDDDAKQGDIAPEGLAFVSAQDSPNGKPLLLSANEVSGTFSIYLIEETEK